MKPKPKYKWKCIRAKDIAFWRALFPTEKAAAEVLGVSLNAFRRWTGAGKNLIPRPPSLRMQQLIKKKMNEHTSPHTQQLIKQKIDEHTSLHIQQLIKASSGLSATKLAIAAIVAAPANEKENIARLLCKWAAEVSAHDALVLANAALVLLSPTKFQKSPFSSSYDNSDISHFLITS